MSKTELRCKKCRILLGVLEDGEITIDRGGYLTAFTDPQTAMLVCYRCATVNLFTLDGDGHDAHRPRRRSA